MNEVFALALPNKSSCCRDSDRSGTRNPGFHAMEYKCTIYKQLWTKCMYNAIYFIPQLATDPSIRYRIFGYMESQPKMGLTQVEQGFS